MNVELSEVEAELLKELLDIRLGELKAEIHHSRVSTFKDQLKKKKDCLLAMIEKLEAVSV